MICQYCNNEIPDGLKVCFHCGKALTGLAQTPVQQTQEQQAHQIMYDPPHVFTSDGEPPLKEKNYSKKSMVLGILSLVTLVVFVGVILSIIGLVFGVIALKEQHPDRSKAIVGVITSGGTVCIVVFSIIVTLVTGGFST